MARKLTTKQAQDIVIVDNGDGTFTVTQDGQPAATITIAATGRQLGCLSIDVAPTAPSTAQAILFGSDVIDRDEDRLITDTGKPNGTIREGAMPFVCVDLTPND